MKKIIFCLVILLAATAVKAQETTLSSPAENRPDTAKIFVAVEKDPSFPGGTQNFYSYLSQNLRYPANAVKNHTEGKVFLSFVVEKDGSLTDVKTLRGVSEDIDAEAIRVVRNSPRWNPAIQNGRAVRFQYAVPITFKLPAPVTIAQNDPLTQQPPNPNKVFTAVETDPRFPGGMEALYTYLTKNLKYPAVAKKNNVKGKVFLTFVVEKDGSLADIKIWRSLSPETDAEAMRLLKECPKWNPGMQNGRPVRVQFTMPIIFDPEQDQ